jgi:HTH-type transcriptional regulator / antitoxin HigA
MDSKNVKVIRTEQQHHAYLKEVQDLVTRGSLSREESERLELLTVLLEAHENNKYPVEPPDPIDAIQFRMHERGLKQADLIPYFGTSSRVSEVLSRKRPLTVPMMKAISIGLGISAETLLGLGMPNAPAKQGSVDWSKFPIAEMVQRGWIRKLTTRNTDAIESVVKGFVADAGLQFGVAAFRRSMHGEAQSPTTKYALYAWLARVIQRARHHRPKVANFEHSALSADFLRELAQLSWSDKGPLLAIEFLEKHGIVVIVERHLKGTQLDGAALRDINGEPIIGMTLRHDRLDNFWYTLLHEVAHIWRHVSGDEVFMDDLDVASEDRREAEANRFAREAFIPRTVWKRSDAFLSPSKESIDKLSRDLRIHPAIIAGRLRHEGGDYRKFSDLVGNNEVRAMIPHTLTE